VPRIRRGQAGGRGFTRPALLLMKWAVGTKRVDGYGRLPTEGTLPSAKDLDLMAPAAVVRLLLREERRSVRAVEAAADAVAAIAAGGRLVYLGAGTSGRLGALDAAECGPTFGARPGQVVAVVAGGARALRRAVEGAEDDARAAGRALARLRVGPRDLVVGIAA